MIAAIGRRKWFIIADGINLTGFASCLVGELHGTGDCRQIMTRSLLRFKTPVPRYLPWRRIILHAGRDALRSRHGERASQCARLLILEISSAKGVRPWN